MNDDLNDTKDNKTLKAHEQQELVKQAGQVLETIANLNAEINFSIKEAQNQFYSTQTAIEEWSVKTKLSEESLKKNLDLLTRETSVLAILPEKLGSRLRGLVPDISAEIQKQTFENLRAELGSLDKEVDSLSNKIQNANKALLEMNQKAWRKKLTYFALVLFITIFASTALSYAIMQRFPTKVTIDTKGDITIDGGNVSVWGTGKNIVQKEGKK